MSKIRECWNCRFYKPYYTKGFSDFKKLSMGHCNADNRIVTDKHQTCDKWRNDSVIKNMRQVVSIRKINSMLDCLLEIRQILAEEKEELEKPNISVLELPKTNRLYRQYLSDANDDGENGK